MGKRGEIVYFPFGEREPSGNSREDEKLDPMHLVEMLEFLTKLAQASPETIGQGNIKIRSKILEENASGADLVRYANQSNKADWQSHPAYYHALIAELKRQNLIPDYSGRLDHNSDLE